MDGNNSKQSNVKSRQVVHVALQLVTLALLLAWSYNILLPFVAPITWGAVLAVALSPLHKSLKKVYKGRGTLAAVTVCVLMLAILIVPSVWLTLKTADEVRGVIQKYQQGNLVIPPPGEKVKTWPLIGRKVDAVWRQASVSLDTLIAKNPNRVKSIANQGIDLLKSTGKGVLIFTLSIIVSAVFLSYSEQSTRFAKALFNRLINSHTFDMAAIATSTIRNVVKGILGVAFIQTILVALGLWIGGIPYAGIWSLCCLILAIVQIGILPVALGVIIYVWGHDTTLTATLLTIWMVFASIIDNILKPILMGKGAMVPMLVVFLGAIGGFIYSGFIGLFTGAVVLSLGYTLFEAWLKGTEI
jgi:predicted PurR-regulated permease PerM